MSEALIIVAALALGSFIKGVTGSGLPLVAIPVMASFLGVERSVVVMAIPGVVGNVWMLWSFRHALAESRDLPVLLGLGATGAMAGTWLLKALDPRILSLALAVLVSVYIALSVSRMELRLRPSVTRWTAPPVGLAAGALQGATGISGPLLQTYLHAYRLEKHVFVVMTVSLYGMFAIVQGVALAGLGLYTPQRLLESLLAIVPMVVMLPVGARVSHRLSQKAFDTAILALLAGAAIKLVYDSLAGG